MRRSNWKANVFVGGRSLRKGVGKVRDLAGRLGPRNPSLEE
jgi:hypothetical protein